MAKSEFAEFEFLPQHNFAVDEYYQKLVVSMEPDAVAYCRAFVKAGGDTQGAYKLVKPNNKKSTAAGSAPEYRRRYAESQAAKQLIAYLRVLMGSYDDHQPVTLEEIVRQTEKDFRNTATDAKTRATLAEKIMKWRGLDSDTVDKTCDLEDSEILATMEAIRRDEGVPVVLS